MAALPDAHPGKRCLVEAFLLRKTGTLTATLHRMRRPTCKRCSTSDLSTVNSATFNCLVDRHSMAHSLEVRGSLLGQSSLNRFLRPADGLESGVRTEKKKAALRRAADPTNLPKDIVASDQNFLAWDESDCTDDAADLRSTNVVAKSTN